MTDHIKYAIAKFDIAISYAHDGRTHEAIERGKEAIANLELAQIAKAQGAAMTNTNCLEGMQCPNPDCKSEGPFRINCEAIFLVTDEGTMDSLGGIEWNDESFCACEKCDNTGAVKDYKNTEAAT